MKFSFSLEGMLTGVAVTVAASVLYPVLKKTAAPLMEAGKEGAAELTHQIKSGVATMREGIEDLVAEAHFERMKQAVDCDL